MSNFAGVRIFGHINKDNRVDRRNAGKVVGIDAAHDQKDVADRFNTGKVQLSFLLEAPDAVRGLCRVLEIGAKKYDRDNWKKGMPFDTVMDSLLRHLLSFKEGEHFDPESGLPHTDHVLANSVFLSQYFHDKENKNENTSKNK